MSCPYLRSVKDVFWFVHEESIYLVALMTVRFVTFWSWFGEVIARSEYQHELIGGNPQIWFPPQRRFKGNKKMLSTESFDPNCSIVCWKRKVYLKQMCKVKLSAGSPKMYWQFVWIYLPRLNSKINKFNRRLVGEDCHFFRIQVCPHCPHVGFFGRSWVTRCSP